MKESGAKFSCNVRYSVSDSNGVLWGEVVLEEWRRDLYHGYLEATPEFQAAVFPLFETHDVLMSEGGLIDEEVEESGA